MMTLGITGYPNAKEARFQLAKRNNLDFIEFCVDVSQDLDGFCGGLGEVKALCEQYGIPVRALGRWGADKISADGKIIEQELQNSYRLIDAAKELGCTVFNTGVNYVDGISYYSNIGASVDFLQKLVDYGRSKGVRIATFNCRWNNYVCDDERYRLIHGHIPELGIKFDPSHSIYAGEDYLEVMKTWGARFYHVHIKGSLYIGGERVDDPPAGMDGTNWGALMSMLYYHKYDGTLSIEPHSATWQGELGEKGVAYTTSVMRSLMF